MMSWGNTTTIVHTMEFQSFKAWAKLLLVGLSGGGSTQVEDASDIFTHEFLDVGGANGMDVVVIIATTIGGMGQTLF